MNKIFMKNINWTGMRYIRTFAGNRFKNSKPPGKADLEKKKEEEADVEKYRAKIWRKHDKIFYYGDFTFILRKQGETVEEENAEGEQIKKRSSGKS